MKKVLMTVALTMALGFAVVAESFNVTNSLAGAVSLISYPTNGPAAGANTNRTGFLTGGPISVANQEYAGFRFEGLPVAGSNGTITVTLVTSQDDSVPGVTPSVSTNLSSAFARNSWDSTAPITLIFGTPVGGWPVTTNAFCWQTNLDRGWIGPANWVGVYSITNATTNSFVLTNVAISLNKKVLPIKLGP